MIPYILWALFWVVTVVLAIAGGIICVDEGDEWSGIMRAIGGIVCILGIATVIGGIAYRAAESNRKSDAQYCLTYPTDWRCVQK